MLWKLLLGVRSDLYLSRGFWDLEVDKLLWICPVAYHSCGKAPAIRQPLHQGTAAQRG